MTSQTLPEPFKTHSRTTASQKATPLWINAAAFQIFWFACVSANDWLALSSLALLLAIHQRYFVQRSSEWIVIALFPIPGLILDSSQMWLGNMNFTGSLQVGSVTLPPIWLISLWIGFATTLAHSFRFFSRIPMIAAIVAFACVPFSYYGGAIISGSELIKPVNAWLLEAIGWGILFPAGLWLARRLAPVTQ